MVKRFSFCLVIVLLAGLLIQPAGAQAYAQTAAENDLSFSEAGYGDRSAKSMYASLSYFLPVAQDLVLSQGTALHLVISHSELLKPEQSTMTVLLDSRSIFSARLDDSNVSQTGIDVELPVEAFGDSSSRAAGYSIVIQFYMRLTDMICEETTNPALWATVHRESYLHLNGERRVPEADLSQLPYPIYVQNMRQPQQLTFSMTPAAGGDEMAVALTLAAYLGQHTADNSLLFDSRLDGEIGASGNFVSIASNGTESAVISLMAEENRSSLEVSGSSPLQAARFLASSYNTAQLTGNQIILQGPFESGENAPQHIWHENMATFLQLGAEERSVPGSGEQITTYYFKRPAGWKLSDKDAQLVLHITHSGQLLPEQSGVRVRINGYEMGGVVYKDKLEDDVYMIPLMAEYLQTDSSGQYTDSLVLELFISQNLRQSGCEPIHPENAWTTIHTDSFFYLPHDELKLPDVSVFPFPYVTQGQNSAVTLVLPDEPHEEELNAALQLAYQIGQSIDGTLPQFTVLFAGENSGPKGDLILIGIEGHNPLIDDIENGRAEAERGIVQSSLDEGISSNLKEFSSPWQQGKYALLLTGQANSLQMLAASMGNNLPSGSILAMTDDGKKMFSLKQEVSPPHPPGSKPVSQPLIPKPETWQVILGVLLVTALAIIITLMFFRLKSKNQEGK